MNKYCEAQVAEHTGRGLHKGYRECARKAWKDGFCKQHHPETAAAKKAKEDEKYRLWNQSTRSYAEGKMKEAMTLIEDGKSTEAWEVLNDYIENWRK